MSRENFAIGIDVGGTNMRAARISPSGEILEKKSIAGSRDPAVALQLIKDLIRDMDGDGARAIGAGIPGRVDGWTGEIISGGFLDLSGVDLKQEIYNTFGRPTIVANDCSMALIGESRRGAAKGLRNAVMMTIGTGIGGAVMENNQIVNGKRCAGQLGHLVVNLGGKPCPCGQRGCVETESSGTSLRRHLSEAGYGPEIRFEHLLQQAEAGDQPAIGVMRAWGNPLRAAINTLSAAFDPDVVLLGGGMGQAAIRSLDFLPELQTWYQVDVRLAELGDDAGVIGCGLAALELVSHAACGAGKRLVMVNGVPASGKSGLSRTLSERTGWPILALDTVKNPFLELIEGVDRPFNRILGRASYKSIFSIIKESPPGSTFIVDAWFGFQPVDVLREHAAMAGIDKVVELWCHAPPDVVGDRYMQRAVQRLPGHPGLAYAPELVELSKSAKPFHLGPVLDVDTTAPINVEEVVTWVTNALASASEGIEQAER
ncbi:ROK family protein [Agrobacterium tumefaciens]|uniref:ROK family protein n=1 Tax=Agrobacterium tumefaciens TaxID=358 RepID=UPI00129760C8|nr:ROK family protein [Agrobacterium tumefaciens]MQB36623.1 ROK family protein [Agrobacterium tumefaciens]